VGEGGLTETSTALGRKHTGIEGAPRGHSHGRPWSRAVKCPDYTAEMGTQDGVAN